MGDRVLVTGVSGFLAGHVAVELLQRGYEVRGSLRSAAHRDAVRDAIAASGGDIARLEFCELDLMRQDGWTAAVRDCRFVHHIASPFVLKMPKDENDLIRPAVDGTRRAVTAALAETVERIVLTSSLAAIDGEHRQRGLRLGPEDWTNIDDPRVTAYAKSKTLAEREAWLIAGHEDKNRLAVINPGTILGPLTSDDPGTSVTIIQRMLKGGLPMIPNLMLPYVDVRDVAAAHVEAMTAPEAGGQRILVTNDAVPLPEIARFLRERFGPSASKVSTRSMPNWFAHLFAHFDRSLRDGLTYLGVDRRYDTSAAELLLGRELRPTFEAVEATARSLLERRLV